MQIVTYLGYCQRVAYLFTLTLHNAAAGPSWYNLGPRARALTGPPVETPKAPNEREMGRSKLPQRQWPAEKRIWYILAWQNYDSNCLEYGIIVISELQ